MLSLIQSYIMFSIQYLLYNLSFDGIGFIMYFKVIIELDYSELVEQGMFCCLTIFIINLHNVMLGRMIFEL